MQGVTPRRCLERDTAKRVPRARGRVIREGQILVEPSAAQRFQRRGRVDLEKDRCTIDKRHRLPADRQSGSGQRGDCAQKYGPADFLDAQGHDVPIMAWIPVRDNSDRQERACKDMVGKSVC